MDVPVVCLVALIMVLIAVASVWLARMYDRERALQWQVSDLEALHRSDLQRLRVKEAEALAKTLRGEP